MNYQQALEYIHSLSRHGWVLGLNRVSRLLARAGNPQNKGKFLHIAGTNGKGSLVQLSGNLLMQAGYKVEKYTSPYVLEFRERFTVNDEMISEPDLAARTTRLKPMVDKLEREGVLITEFEFITVLAFCWFAQMGCDIVCLEVGLGGRFDATNVISNPVACLIASISLDNHTAILGDTVEEIAAEKGGILKPGCPAVIYPEMNPGAAQVLRIIGAEVGARVIQPDPAAVSILEETPFGSRFAVEGEGIFGVFGGAASVLSRPDGAGPPSCFAAGRVCGDRTTGKGRLRPHPFSRKVSGAQPPALCGGGRSPQPGRGDGVRGDPLPHPLSQKDCRRDAGGQGGGRKPEAAGPAFGYAVLSAGGQSPSPFPPATGPAGSALLFPSDVVFQRPGGIGGRIGGIGPGRNASDLRQLFPGRGSGGPMERPAFRQRLISSAPARGV